MSTSLLDNGEAYLSAADKRFARVREVRSHIQSAEAFAFPPVLAGVMIAVAVAGLTIVAFAV